jgi:hypothetical protein
MEEVDVECRDVRPLIEAYLSDELLVETTGAVVAHLERCHACRAEVEGVRRLRQAVRGAFSASRDLEARPEFLTALGDTLRAKAAGPRPMTRRAWLAVAAGLVGAVGSGALWRLWSRTNVDRLAATAVGDHRFCALNFQLDEPPISLDEAARRFGGPNRALNSVEPDTSVPGVGAVKVLERHSCVYDGHRFAHIVVSYKDEPASVLVTDSGDASLGVWGVGPTSGGDIARLSDHDGFRVAAFHRGGQIAFVVSSLEPSDVAAVARAMAGPVMRAIDSEA